MQLLCCLGLPKRSYHGTNCISGCYIASARYWVAVNYYHTPQCEIGLSLACPACSKDNIVCIAGRQAHSRKARYCLRQRVGHYQKLERFQSTVVQGLGLSVYQSLTPLSSKGAPQVTGSGWKTNLPRFEGCQSEISRAEPYLQPWQNPGARSL